VVEDDADLREAVIMALSRAGFRVSSAANGREALDQVAREMPAVILLDMTMPIMSGFEFAVEFRSRYDRRAAIVVTSVAPGVAQKAQEIQADDYLDKPFKLSALISVVERHLRGGVA
jgi:DNA-binding response OmpR family regulator